jgi:hypothetical protein
MNTPNDFGIDLGTRIALHNMLLQKLFARLAREQGDPEQFLRNIERDLVASFEPDVLNADGANLTPQQQDWLKQQSAFGKDLASQFIKKTAKLI